MYRCLNLIIELSLQVRSIKVKKSRVIFVLIFWFVFFSMVALSVHVCVHGNVKANVDDTVYVNSNVIASTDDNRNDCGDDF